MLSGPVAKWVQDQYGSMAVLQTTRPVATTAGFRILGFNPNRPQWLIVNTGIQAVTIQWERLDTGATGLVLAGGGSSVGVNARDDFLLPIFDVYVFTMAATSALYIIEMVAQQ